MRKLYYLFFLLPLLSLISCEKDNNEVVNMQHQDPSLTVTAISSVQGYAGDQFTITGTDFGAAKQFMKVFIGQNQTKTISCSDEKVVVEVPEEATTGKISIELLGETITSEWIYKVLDKPSVETMNPIWGFVGDEITFGGSNLGVKAEDIQLYFGTSKTRAKVTSWTPESFAVEIPADATSGKITLNIATQKEMNTPDEFMVREHATLIAVTPAKAYKKSKLTITGTHLGTTTEGVKVLFGDKEGEVVSCTENAIEVKVPMEATEGSVKVTVETFYEKVDGVLDFTVTSTPVVAANGITPLEGYIGSEITITGTKMPVNVNDMEVTFGTIEAEIAPASYTVDGSGKGVLKVRVPNGLDEGNVKVGFTIAGLEICSKDFKVLPAPTIHTFDHKLIKAGSDITITGTGFMSNVNDVDVDFNGTIVHPKTISSTAMTIHIPAGFIAGKLSITFKGVPVKEVGELQVLAVGDITNVVLKNCTQPFERMEEKATEWATAKDWLYNDTFAANGGSIQYPAKDGNKETGLIALLKWGKLNLNGKMYQAIRLPNGKYKATLNVARCGSDKGRFKAYFIVAKGATLKDIPDLNDPNEWNNKIPDSIINSFDITSQKTDVGYAEDVEFNLAGEENEIMIGFVTQLQGNGWITLSSIQLSLIE